MSAEIRTLRLEQVEWVAPSSEWIRDSFTRLRKAAQHPLLLRNARLYPEAAVLRIARCLCFEREFAEAGSRAPGTCRGRAGDGVRINSLHGPAILG